MVVAAGKHGDGAGGQACGVAAGVDAAREAGDDGEARAAEIARQPLGKAQARGRGIAGADDGDRRQMQRRGLAAHSKKGRGVVDHLQPARIVGLPSATKATPRAFAALSSRSASWREWTRVARLAATRRGRSGSAASAARAPPQWLTSARKVRGPTLSLRMRQSQSSRWSSLSRTPSLSLLTG